jgi:iron-sulfur cluster assembly protein
MFPVEISEKAAFEIKKVMEEQSLEDSALRVGLQGGGCSGFQYLLNFIKEEEASEDEDYVDQQGDIKVVVDKKSATYLQGTVIDFHSGIDKRGFVFNNPGAAKSCGCGSSFSPNESSDGSDGSDGAESGGCGTGGCGTGGCG